MADQIKVERHWLTRRWKARVDGVVIVLPRQFTAWNVLDWVVARFPNPELSIEIRDGHDSLSRTPNPPRPEIG